MNCPYNLTAMNLHNPFALAGMTCVLTAAFWFILAKKRQRGQTAAGGLNAMQVIFLLSLLAMLVLAVVLTWNDRAISMPLLGSLLGSVISGLPLLQPTKKEKADLKTVGEQSPSVRTDGKVTISYGGKPSGGYYVKAAAHCLNSQIAALVLCCSKGKNKNANCFAAVRLAALFLCR